MSRKRLVISLLLIAFVMATVTTIVASGLINVINPEAVRGPVIVPPQLVPPDQGDYVAYPVGPVIVPPDHRPVAQLHSPPADLAQDIAVKFPDLTAPDVTTMSYAIIASVRYRGQGHTVLVTTARPSPAAAQTPSVLGNQSIKLDDGSTAWVTTGVPGDTPNQVVFLRGDLIITIASDLPVSKLRTLAAQTVVERPY